MAEVLVIPTCIERVVLRQLATDADDIAYHQAVLANPEHLSQFGDKTYEKYQTLEAVRKSRLEPENPHRLRMGIWDGEMFVGSINMTPLDYTVAKIGYWLDGQYLGHGYATTAVRALMEYTRSETYYDLLLADVRSANTKSAAVLRRTGFVKTANVDEYDLFEFPPPEAQN